jgi:uncharacterized protein YxjI
VASSNSPDLRPYPPLLSPQSGLRATVSKQWFAWSDTYGVDIAEGEDDILILVSTVVVDMACHANQQRR